MNIDDVLSGRTGSQGIRLLLSTTAKKALADQLRALLPAGATVGPCHLREVSFKLGRKLTAYYDALVSKGSGEEYRVRPIAVTWGADINTEQPEQAGELQAEAVSRAVGAPFRQLLADDPELGMHIQVWPLDARFPQLVRLSDPQHAEAMLADAQAWRAGGSQQRRTTNCKITAIKYRPARRHVLRYDTRDAETESAVYAKLYIIEERKRAYRREDGARVYRLAAKVADWLAEHGAGAQGLRPFAYVSPDAVVLYPRVCGEPLGDYGQRSKRDAARWVERAGAALRTLHQLPEAFAGPLAPLRDFAAEIGQIARLSRHLHALLPNLGSTIEALLDRARELHERLPGEPPAFTHGDLKCEHFWVASDRLTLMDFDNSHLGDTAFDVGCFLADWQFWNPASRQAELDEMRETFLAGYAPGVPKERLVRVRLYEALGLIKCAVRRVQLFEHDWAPRTAGLVARAQAVLDHLQFTFGIPRYGSAATTGEQRRELR